METSNYEFDLNEELIDFSRKFQNYKYQRNENQNQFPTFVIENLNLLKVNLNNSRNNSKTTFFKNMLFACDVLIDYSWEMLNTNIWIFVDEIWRLLYGYSVLYKIILLKKQFSSSQNFAHSGSNDNDNDELKLNENIVKLCDLGLLMCGPLLEKQFDQIIRFIRKSNSSNLKSKIGSKETPLESQVSIKIRKLDHVVLNEDEKFLLNIESSPTVDEFNRKYFLTKTPVIIDNQMTHWPALQKWNIDYILDIAGNRTVPIELGSKYTDENWSQKLMTIKEFVNKFVNQVEPGTKGYLAQHPLFDQIPELKEDIYIPEYCVFLSQEDDIETNVDVNAWFGPAGTVSPLHYDPKPNFLCQVIGQKYVRLYDEKYSDCLYPSEGNILRNTSQIDVENPDLGKFPLAGGLPYWEGILKPGQMLFIPPKCWHYIRSLSLSFSVSFWWN